MEKPISPGQWSFRIGQVWGGFNTGKIVPVSRLPWRGGQQRNNGGCLSSPCPSATQLSLSSYVSCASGTTDPPLEPKASVCMRVSLCTGPLRGASEFSGCFCLTQTTRIPIGFYSKNFSELFFSGLEPWDRDPLCGARAPVPSGWSLQPGPLFL